MPPDPTSLYLYNLTLRPPSCAFHSLVGNFSGSRKVQELVVSTGSYLDIYRPDAELGKLRRLSRQNAFAHIQLLAKIRPSAGSDADILVLTSDSGCLTFARFLPISLRFVPFLQEPYAKPALRRFSPGPYLAVDPRHQALMVGGIENSKIVFSVESDPPKTASPLDVPLKGVATLALCALDTNFANPVWAALETRLLSGPEYLLRRLAAPLALNFYEFDRGLNHVALRRCLLVPPPSASHLVPLPHPVGGVLVCCDSLIIHTDWQALLPLAVRLPTRAGAETAQVVCLTVHTLKKTDFFVLLQTSVGDLYKLTAVSSETGVDLRVTYFDTIPACSTLEIFRSGFLFANTVNTNKYLYQFELLGTENDTTQTAAAYDPTTDYTTNTAPTFTPVGLQNLALVDILDALTPLTDAAIVDAPKLATTDPVKSLVTLALHAFVKTLKFGVPTTELVSSPLPMTPTAVFATKLTAALQNDQYLVLSSSLDEQTSVLLIGEVVEEVTDSQFVLTQHTLAVQQVGSRSVVQVHTNGVRCIRHVGDNQEKITTDWFPPAGISVVHVALNSEQLVLGLSNRELCYFEIDPTDDQLVEYQLRYEVSGAISALAINSHPLGLRKSAFAVIGCSDETITVLSLLPHNCFEVLMMQALSSTCRSLLMLPLDRDNLYVHIGMENGVYVRVNIDMILGKLSDTRLKYLGPRYVSLSAVSLPDFELPQVLAISSQPWVGFFSMERTFKFFPLIGSQISCGTSFFSEDIGVESVVGIHNNTLSIFTLGLEESGLTSTSDFVISAVKLRYTPRKQVALGDLIVVMESEFNVKSPFIGTEDVDEDYYDAFGFERQSGSWASCIQVVDAENVLQTFEFENNESAVTLGTAVFNGKPHLIVSTSKDVTFSPSGCSANYLYTFKVVDRQLVLLHKTTLDAQASALEAFGGKLVVAVNSQIRMYELGKKQLLRKSTSTIEHLRRVSKMLHMGGDILVVGDGRNSFVFLQYDPADQTFFAFANDVMARQITTFAKLDNRTVIGGDKFGNIFVNRLPATVAEQLNDNVLVKFLPEFLGGAGGRLSKMCEFYIPDIPTSFQKGSFVVGGTESIIYTGLSGTVGILLPIETIHDVNHVSKLELLMRKYLEVDFDDLSAVRRPHNLVGREHSKFRGYYNPVKNVIDGDYVEKYYELDQATKIKIAGELQRTPRDVERKLYELRNKAAF